MPLKRRLTGKFWPAVRARIWERAEELFTEEFLESHEKNPTKPTRRELREGGYFYTAKCLILREINRMNQGSSRQERQDEVAFLEYMEKFGEK